MAQRIVIVDDSEDLLDLYRQVLEDETGYEVVAVSYKDGILDEIKKAKPDLVICDYLFGQQPDGWRLVQMLRLDRDTEDVPIIVCSGAEKQLRDLEAQLAEKNIALLMKPFDIDELLTLVASRIRQ
jgi:CheY-like chemotaxis protein